MLVLVSPAKTLDYESDMSVSDFSVASHLSDSQLLVKELQKALGEGADGIFGSGTEAAVNVMEKSSILIGKQIRNNYMFGFVTSISFFKVGIVSKKF